MTTIPVEPPFTAPHPIDQTEVTFDMTKRRKGVCKFFNSQKGFGFINDDHPDELGNQEVFVHYTSIGGKGGFRSLAEGEEVEYVVSPGQKGFQATEVTGPAGRAVQGDVKSKLPKTPTFLPYPMGIMPAYAIGAGSPYMQAEPYMSPHPGSVYAGSPYASQVFYLPSPVGVLPAGHSPSLGQMSPYPNAQSPHTNIRSPTVPFTHNQHGQMAMALSPQVAAGGFGFASPSVSYGFGTAGSNVLGHSTGSAGDMRSPGIGLNTPNGSFAPQAHPASAFAGANPGLGLRADSGTGETSGRHGRDDRRGSHSGGGGTGLGAYSTNSLVYTSGGQATY